MSTGTIALADSYSKTVPRELAAAASQTLVKLMMNPESPGLHVEPIQQAADPRIRSIRVNRQYRILAFHLPRDGKDHWVVNGVYDHDEAYRIARILYLRINPITGATEFRDDPAPTSTAADPSFEDSAFKRRVAEEVARELAEREEREARERAAQEVGAGSDDALDAAPDDPAAEDRAPQSSGPVLRVSVEDLVDELGIDREVAEAAVLADEDALLALAASSPTWQGSALLELATGETLDRVREMYSTGVTGGTPIGVPSGTDDVVDSLNSEKSKDRFRLIRDDKELSRVLASGDFAKWRVFLHPEQRTYVDVRTRGPYRLTGGAGTGKTVVLVHRAVKLARDGEKSGRTPRIVLTTFTRNLADSLSDQVRLLDATVPRGATLGGEGIHVAGVDRLVHGVVSRSRQVAGPMETVLGWSTTSPSFARKAADWEVAVAAAGHTPDQPHLSPEFLATEYGEVILPHRVTDEATYLRVARTGRGTRLGRRQRREVWEIVTRYREDGMRSGSIDYDEAAAIAAAVLDATAEAGKGRPADHVLVDEGQDLRPAQWQFLRALAAPGPDDMFLAEDSHQRIYSNPVRLGRYGIAITGRSRRLKLNYRTTAQNLAFAVSVLEGGEFDIAAMEEEGAEPTQEQGTFRSARSGPVPQLMPNDTLAGELETVAGLLSTWIDEVLEEDLDPSTIGLLTRWVGTRDLLVRALDERGIKVASVDRNEARSGAPLAMTFHRAKGMEFSRVILFGIDEGSVRRLSPTAGYDEQAVESAELQERSLLYVGASRARDRLAVTWNKEPSPLLGLAGGADA